MANNQIVIKFSLLFYTVFMLFDIFASFFIIINIKTRKKIRKSSNKKTTYSYMWSRPIFFDKLAWIFFYLFLCHFIYTDIHINHFSIWPIMILCVIIWIYVNNWRPEAIKIDIYIVPYYGEILEFYEILLLYMGNIFFLGQDLFSG